MKYCLLDFTPGLRLKGGHTPGFHSQTEIRATLYSIMNREVLLSSFRILTQCLPVAEKGCGFLS